jgi:putative thioredoxin
MRWYVATYTTPYVIDVDEQTFQTEVIERSRTTLVVVDLWAPWCGPCRVIGPVLERLAAEAKGAFVLAKVNVDENQRLAGMFRVQSIPAVKAVLNAQIVDEFLGALPEPQIRAWLERLLPNQAPAEEDDLLAAAKALELENPAEAAARYRVLLGEEPNNEQALFGLGKLLVLQGEAEGRAALQQISSASDLHAAAQAWLALAAFFERADAGADGSDSASRYARAAAAAKQQDYKAAIDELLAIVMRDRAFEDDAARKTLLALFDALGNEHELVAPSRRKLANYLF